MIERLRWLHVHVVTPGLDDVRNWWAELREQREWVRRDVERRERERNERILSNFARRKHFECPHDDYLCARYGCPDDPRWTGDRK